MKADISAMGKSFLRLAYLKDTELHEDAAEEGITTYDMHYTLADEGEVQDGAIAATAEQLGPVTVLNVATVTCMGDAQGQRWYTGRACVLQDAQGRVWIDEQLHDDVFC
jgi:hypothetical protein